MLVLESPSSPPSVVDRETFLLILIDCTSSFGEETLDNSHAQYIIVLSTDHIINIIHSSFNTFCFENIINNNHAKLQTSRIQSNERE